MSRDRDRDKKRDQEDEEEAYERRKLERKLRDKEAAYQEVGKCIRFTLHHCECLNSECETCPETQQFIFVLCSGHYIFANISHSIHVALLRPVVP